MQRLQRYFQQSWSELSKVVWPTRQQAIQLTIAVIVFSLLAAVFLGGIDYVFTRILELLILKG